MVEQFRGGHVFAEDAEYVFSVVELVALRRVAPRTAAQLSQSDFFLFVPPAVRGRVRRSATNSTTDAMPNTATGTGALVRL